MVRKKISEATPSKNGHKVSQPAPKRSELPPYPQSLCTGAPYDVDDLDDPENGSIYGTPEFIAPSVECDKDGVPVVSDFLRRSYDWQIECWDRECRELLAKYGCGIDPRDPIPAPPPDKATEIERDAYRLVRAAWALKKRFRAGDYSGAIIAAIDLGSLKRKIQSRWADNLVDRGAKHARTTRKMQRARWGEKRLRQSSEKQQDARRLFADLKAIHPKWKDERIVNRVASDIGRSSRTVWRYLKPDAK